MENDVEIARVPALEYVALCRVADMVKVAMTNPGAGGFLAEAFCALDAVRRDLGIDLTGSNIDIEAGVEGSKSAKINKAQVSCASDLAMSLIERARK